MRTSSPRSVELRATIHAVLADQHRLRICDALMLSDRAPSELAAALGIGSNLLAHHLKVLADTGLTEAVVSSGDRRRRYVRLIPGALEGFVTPAAGPRHATSILFVCKQNSARSQLALALWRARSSVAASSAGTVPAATVHPGARRAATRHGLDLGGAVPRSIAEVGKRPDLLITICDEANEALDLDGRLARYHWSIPDPAASGHDRAFDQALGAIEERVEALNDALVA